MVADALVYHPTVAHYLRFVATTVGRDKVLRLIQYYARFYAWYLFRTNGSPKEIAPYTALMKQFGAARKVMRLGKNVEHFKAAAIAADNKSLDPVLKYLAVGRQLGYAGYLSIDSLTFLDSAGIKPNDTLKKLGREGLKLWIAGIIFSTASGIYSLYGLKQRAAAIDKKDGESAVESKKLEKERFAVQLQLISDLCDITIPGTMLGWLQLDDGIVGLAGITSSLIGLYSTWKKTA